VFYSIYNWSKQAYDVFESSNGEANGQRPIARRKGPGPRGPGQQLESLLPVLPTDAVFLRTSKRPVGRISIHHGSPAVGLGWSPDESLLVRSPWMVLGVGIVGLLLGYRLINQIARRL
jgi:hypothetical protein